MKRFLSWYNDNWTVNGQVFIHTTAWLKYSDETDDLIYFKCRNVSHTLYRYFRTKAAYEWSIITAILWNLNSKMNIADYSHSQNSEDVIICEICKRTFSSKRGLSIHQRKCAEKSALQSTLITEVHNEDNASAPQISFKWGRSTETFLQEMWRRYTNKLCTGGEIFSFYQLGKRVEST